MPLGLLIALAFSLELLFLSCSSDSGHMSISSKSDQHFHVIFFSPFYPTNVAMHIPDPIQVSRNIHPTNPGRRLSQRQRTGLSLAIAIVNSTSPGTSVLGKNYVSFFFIAFHPSFFVSPCLAPLLGMINTCYLTFLHFFFVRAGVSYSSIATDRSGERATTARAATFY